MSYQSIITHCAPTLAGIKVGSLFSQRFEDLEDLRSKVRHCNRLLRHKGIRFLILRVRNGQALIYVYRQKQLDTLLKQPAIQNFLAQMGYQIFTQGACLSLLRTHLHREDFPHEIGIFLGYPLADIQAFIANKGRNCVCEGCWKVYTNHEQAQKTFAKYKKCTAVYGMRLAEGFDMTRLTVAV
ncbi:DUF3793 family protein [Bengtsoniella intestinalis]|uniref:DUF3793 family protein n=1 Tax=Bengtsoniella intestinalis TaxID=3073143 RepID=UPI00391F2305